MFGLVKNLAKGFMKKKSDKAQNKPKKEIKESPSSKDIKSISSEDLKNRNIPQENSNIEQKDINVPQESQSKTTSAIIPKKDFSGLDKKIEESDNTLQNKVNLSRKKGIASAIKGNKGKIQEGDLKTTVKGLKGFIADEMEQTREEIRNINSDSDNSIGKKIQAIKQVTKDNLEINKDSLKTQKSSFELAKDEAYNRAHQYKESLKKAATKVKEKGTTVISTGVGAIKDVKDKSGGWIQTIMKILGGAYLLKKFWPLIKEKLWPAIKDKMWPWVKKTLWPFIKDNFMEILGGMGIAAFLANPIKFLTAPLKLALKATGSIGKFLIKNVSKLALKALGGTIKGLGKVASELATGTKDLLGTIGSKVKDGAIKVATKAKDGVISLGSAIKDKVKEKLAPLSEAIADKVKVIKDGLKDKFAPLTKKLSGIATGAKDLATNAMTKMGKAGSLISKLGGTVGAVGTAGGKAKKIAVKGFAGLLKVLKPLAKIIPFVGPVLMALDLIDTLFPNLKTIIWDKIKAGVKGISTWISDKMSGMIDLIRGGLAGLISSTYGKLPVVGKYANQLADFIRGKKVTLDDEVKYGATKKDKKTAEHAQTKLENRGLIEHNILSKDEIKDWGAIEKLPSGTIKGLIASGNFSEEDNDKMKKIIDTKKAKADKDKVETAKEAAKPQSQKDKEQYDKNKKTLVNLTKSIQTFNTIIEKGKETGANTKGVQKALSIQYGKRDALKAKIQKYERSQKSKEIKEQTPITTSSILNTKPANQTLYTMSDGKGGSVNISKKDNDSLNNISAEYSKAMDKHDNAKLEELSKKQDELRKEILDKINNQKIEATEPGTSSKKPIDQKLGMNSFGVGGYTGTGKDDEIAGVVHKNEYVLTPKDLKELNAAAKEGDNDSTIKKTHDNKTWVKKKDTLANEVKKGKLKKETKDDTSASDLEKDVNDGGSGSTAEEVKHVSKGIMKDASQSLKQMFNLMDGTSDVIDGAANGLFDGLGLGADLKGDAQIKMSKDMGTRMTNAGSSVLNSSANLFGGIKGGITNSLGLSNVTSSEAGDKVKDIVGKGANKAGELLKSGKNKLTDFFGKSKDKKSEEAQQGKATSGKKETVSTIGKDSKNIDKTKNLTELAAGPTANETKEKKTSKGVTVPSEKNKSLATSKNGEIKEIVTGSENKEPTTGQKIQATISNDIKNSIKSLSSMMGGQGNVDSISDIIGGGASRLFDGLGLGADLKGDAELQTEKAFGDRIGNFGSGIVDSGTGLFGSITGGITNSLGLSSVTGSQAADKVKKNAIKGINSIKKATPDSVKAMASKGFDSIKGFANETGTKAKSMFGIAKDKLGSIFGKKDNKTKETEGELTPGVAAEIPTEAANQTELRSLDKTANQLGEQAKASKNAVERVQVKNKREAGPKDIGRAGEKLAQKTANKENAKEAAQAPIINNITQAAPSAPEPELTLANTSVHSGDMDAIGILF